MKKLLSLLLSLSFLFCLSACSLQSSQKRYTNSFIDLFDTVSSVTAYDSSEHSFNEHYSQFYNELKAYAQLYDIYEDYDGVVNLKYINENAAKAPVEVDKRIMELLLFGKEVYEISEGRVNICMGSVLSVWHIERENGIENPGSASLPDMELLKEKAEHTDIDKLILDEENMTVYFADAEMQLDAGAIAKGYAAEKISEYIVQNKIWTSVVISLGGNVKTIGIKNDDGNTPFVIGIENPKNNTDYIAKINASAQDTVVTSGDYQRYYTVDGVNYCHIINPKTLMPADFMSSVSVVSKNSAYADMLSTALFNMRIEDGLNLVNGMSDTEAMWVDKNGEITYSDNFKNYAVK